MAGSECDPDRGGSAAGISGGGAGSLRGPGDAAPGGGRVGAGDLVLWREPQGHAAHRGGWRAGSGSTTARHHGLRDGRAPLQPRLCVVAGAAGRWPDGWAAEGDSADYYLEPVTLGLHMFWRRPDGRAIMHYFVTPDASAEPRASFTVEPLETTPQQAWQQVEIDRLDEALDTLRVDCPTPDRQRGKAWTRSTRRFRSCCRR